AGPGKGRGIVRRSHRAWDFGTKPLPPAPPPRSGEGGGRQVLLPLSASGRGPGGGVLPLLPLSVSGRGPGGGVVSHRAHPFGGTGTSPLGSCVDLLPVSRSLRDSGVSLAMYSGRSTPPMSRMICIIGGMVRARFCRKWAVFVVPLPLPPF